MDELDLTQKNVVYGLYCVCRKCEGETPEWIRYVGITIQEARVRLTEHLKPYRKKMPYPVDRWKFKHGTENIRMRILEVVPLDGDLYEREVYWIEHYKTFTDDNQGGLNRTRGGRAEQSQYSRAAIKEANSRDGISWAKLSYEKAAQIRKQYREGVPTRLIAEEFGINQGHVTDVVRNRAWVDPDYVYERRETVFWEDPENPSWAISREDAYELRDLYTGNPDATYQDMADKYGVSCGVVRNVLFNQIWKSDDYEYTPRAVGPLQRKKISQAQKGKPKPEGHGAKVSQAIRGEAHGMGKLDTEKVIEIRKLGKTGMRHVDIGALYGISQTQTSRIIKGQRWAHVREGLDD